mmetsp:Transcript_6318/g.14829  ORF Transcript_6318/g.14829 Transcript_6318/m.14829 type:complete len:99 (+) Transcript_6318:753-1049(+)
MIVCMSDGQAMTIGRERTPIYQGIVKMRPTDCDISCCSSHFSEQIGNKHVLEVSCADVIQLFIWRKELQLHYMMRDCLQLNSQAIELVLLTTKPWLDD